MIYMYIYQYCFQNSNSILNKALVHVSIIAISILICYTLSYSTEYIKPDKVVGQYSMSLSYIKMNWSYKKNNIKSLPSYISNKKLYYWISFINLKNSLNVYVSPVTLKEKVINLLCLEACYRSMCTKILFQNTVGLLLNISTLVPSSKLLFSSMYISNPAARSFNICSLWAAPWLDALAWQNSVLVFFKKTHTH